MNNREYFYPLYKEEDKRAYAILIETARKRDFPKIVDSESELNEFLKLMVYTGKSRDYRKFRDIIVEDFQKRILNIPKLLERGKAIKIPRGIDKSWAVFTQDKRICELLDEFMDTKITFVGNIEGKVEFIKRYLLTQLLQDWRGPKLAVTVEALERRKVKLSNLNKLLRIWDFTKIFSDTLTRS